MKKTVSLILSSALVLALASCGDISSPLKPSGEFPSFLQVSSEGAVTGEFASSGDTVTGEQVSSEESFFSSESDVSSDISSCHTPSKENVSPSAPVSSAESSSFSSESEVSSSTEGVESDYSYLSLGEKFYSKFNLDNSVTYTDSSYTSGRLHVEIVLYRYEDANIYVADIYLCDIESLIGIFANDTFGDGNTETIASMAERTNSVVAVNGDFYNDHADSFLVRNGELYFDVKADDDICLLYSDGRMETFFEKEFDREKAKQDDIWQVFGFGPKLMDNGEVLYDPPGSDGFAFNSKVKPRNPRTAVGYYEPGHYCLVFVEGRNDNSKGLEMNQLAAFMGEIGCTDAFNLDGGKSSVMVFMGKVVGVPYEGGRASSDAIGIKDLSPLPKKEEE